MLSSILLASIQVDVIGLGIFLVSVVFWTGVLYGRISKDVNGLKDDVAEIRRQVNILFKKIMGVIDE
jgi:hypothetical protein